MCLAGLDCVAPEEVCEVQRCAWVAYANLRSAARCVCVWGGGGCVCMSYVCVSRKPDTNRPCVCVCVCVCVGRYPCTWGWWAERCRPARGAASRW